MFQYVDDIIAAREQANDKLREELVRYLIQDTIFLLNLAIAMKRQKMKGEK